eukprot:5180431-Prymnesium_polylepis.1
MAPCRSCWNAGWSGASSTSSAPDSTMPNHEPLSPASMIGSPFVKRTTDMCSASTMISSSAILTTAVIPETLSASL